MCIIPVYLPSLIYLEAFNHITSLANYYLFTLSNLSWHSFWPNIFLPKVFFYQIWKRMFSTKIFWTLKFSLVWVSLVWYGFIGFIFFHKLIAIHTNMFVSLYCRVRPALNCKVDASTASAYFSLALIRPSSRLTVSVWVSPSSTPACSIFCLAVYSYILPGYPWTTHILCRSCFHYNICHSKLNYTCPCGWVGRWVGWDDFKLIMILISAHLALN